MVEKSSLLFIIRRARGTIGCPKRSGELNSQGLNIGCAVRPAKALRRAEKLGSIEDLRFALKSMGSFFRTTALSLLLGILATSAVLLYQQRPSAKSPPPAPAPAPVKDRVTI